MLKMPSPAMALVLLFAILAICDPSSAVAFMQSLTDEQL